MKKIILFILFVTAMPMTMMATEELIGSILYDLDSSTKTATVIRDYNGPYSGSIIIPFTVSGSDGVNYRVTKIGDEAFRDCDNLTSVVIGDNVMSIGESAFLYCYNLTSVNFGNSLTSIGNSAFSGCSSLSNVTFGNSLTIIGNSAFSGCSSLSNVTFGNSLTSIGNSAFSGCSSLSNVTFGNNLTSIGGKAFSGCSNLTSVEIPSSVTNIGSLVFYNSGLKTIITGQDAPQTDGVIIDYWKSVDHYIRISDLSLFCKNGNQWNLVNKGGSGSSPVNVHLLQGNTEITSLIIPNDVTSIGDDAFYGCRRLTTVDFSSSKVTTIGISAFRECFSLTSVIFPTSLTTIESDAFSNCI